jgi:hypothetical protein
MSASLSPTFLSACAKLRANDPSVLPGRNSFFTIRGGLSEAENIAIAEALTQSTAVSSLQLDLNSLRYSVKAAEAMGEYLLSSIHLQRVDLFWDWHKDSQKALSILLRALQDSTSVKELRLLRRECHNAGSESTVGQDLTSLLLLMPNLRNMDVGTNERRSFPAKNETLQDLTLTNHRSSNLTYILQCLGHSCPTTLRTLCIQLHEGDLTGLDTCSSITELILEYRIFRSYRLGRGFELHEDDLTGLDTLIKSKHSNITELILDGGIYRSYRLVRGFENLLRALERKNTLTKLEMRDFPLSLDQVRDLQMVLRNQKKLQTLALRRNSLESAHLAEIAAGLEQHMSITTLDLSGNNFNDMDSAVILRNIIHGNKSIAKLDLSYNSFGIRPEAVRCVAMGLRRSATLLEIDLACCRFENQGFAVLAETLFSSAGKLKKLILSEPGFFRYNCLRPLVEAMIEHESQITHLALNACYIGDEGASYLANALANNALPHLAWVSGGDFGDDGLINLVSALETNQSLNELDLSWNAASRFTFSERGFLALANSLPAIRKLKRIHFRWSPGLLSAMPSLLEGLRDNTSVVQFNITKSTKYTLDDTSFPLTDQNTAKYSGGWMMEMQYLGFRNRFSPMIRAPLETAPPLGFWAPALARVSMLPGVLFYVLRSKADIVSSGIA